MVVAASATVALVAVVWRNRRKSSAAGTDAVDDEAAANGHSRTLETAVICVVGPGVLIWCSILLFFSKPSAGVQTKDKLDTVCVSLSVLSVLCVPQIIRTYLSRLEHYQVDVAERQAVSGPFGLVMFVHGVLDLCSDAYLCFDIFFCRKRIWMGVSFATNLFVSSLTTGYLSTTALATIERGDTPRAQQARQWHIDNSRWVTVVTIASLCRIESLAILRLQLADEPLWWFPIEDKHFHFLQYSGWFHFILADVPHLTVAVALLVDTDSQCDSWLPAWLSAPLLSIFFSCGSILWGFVSRAGQWAVAQASRSTGGPTERLLASQAAEIEALHRRVAELTAQLSSQHPQRETESESLGHGQRLPAVGMAIGASRPGSPGLHTELVGASGAE